MNAQPSTWASLLTPAGTGAIGVIRVQGPDAREVLGRVYHPHDSSRPVGDSDGRLAYGTFVDGDETIDDVIISVAAGHNGFDIYAHGGIRVTERILQALADRGAPLADEADPIAVWPCASRLDAEVVMATTTARTERAVMFLARNRKLLSDALGEVNVVAARQPEAARASLLRMLDRSRAARVLIDGATVALIGPPNSGKSTLFNRLVGRNAVVVSPQPGTTRDWVSAWIVVDGVPLTLIDTAGIRTVSDALETQAIRSGQSVVAEASARLLLLDGSVSQVLDHTSIPDDKRVVLVFNKLDRGCRVETTGLKGLARTVPVCNISAVTGAGVDALLKALLSKIGFDDWSDRKPAFFSQRQVDLSISALSALEAHDMAAFGKLIDGLIGL